MTSGEPRLARADGGDDVLPPDWPERHGGGGLDIIRHSEDASGRARGGIFRVRGEMDPGLKWRGLFIEVEGARRVQMRCGLRPRDHDRTL